VAERLIGVACFAFVCCSAQAAAMPGRGSDVSASAFGLPEYGAAVSAGVIPADNPQVVNFLAVADFNGDGRDDVMVVRALYQSNRTFPVVVLANQGNGRFVDQTASIFDGAPPQTMDARRVVVADFNGDGRPDVFIADEGQDVTPNVGHQNTLILSAPGGKLVDATANLPQRSDFSHALAVADVNGDARPICLSGTWATPTPRFS
jgi:VCBS repeat protein